MTETNEDLTEQRRQEGRCLRCGNWPQICGHDLPFKERMKSTNIQRMWAGTR